MYNKQSFEIFGSVFFSSFNYRGKHNRVYRNAFFTYRFFKRKKITNDINRTT